MYSVTMLQPANIWILIVGVITGLVVVQTIGGSVFKSNIKKVDIN